MATRLGLVILAVADLARAVRFYRAAFDWTVTVDVPVYVEFALPNGTRVGLYDRVAFAANTGSAPHAVPPGALAPTELYLYPDGDDFAAAIERVAATGARTLSPLAARAWGDDAAYFADPDGNVIVLARPTA